MSAPRASALRKPPGAGAGGSVTDLSLSRFMAYSQNIRPRLPTEGYAPIIAYALPCVPLHHHPYSAWECFKSGDGHVYTARPKAYRLTNKPMTMSCICVVFEKQSVLRTKRFMRVRKVRCVRSIFWVLRLPGLCTSGSRCRVWAPQSGRDMARCHKVRFHIPPTEPDWRLSPHPALPLWSVS